MRLAAADVVSVEPGTSVSRAAFDQDWGQFEVLVRKSAFPISAPNCRSTIILRMPAAGPGTHDRSKRLDARWEQFRAFHQLIDGTIDHLDVSLARQPYMAVGNDGKLALQYCNAFLASPSDTG